MSSQIHSSDRLPKIFKFSNSQIFKLLQISKSLTPPHTTTFPNHLSLKGMKQLLFSLFLLIMVSAGAKAQDPDPKKLHETAKTFIRTGDYNNSVLVLNKAIQLDPNNIELQKDLAFALYLKKDYANALTIAKPLADRKDVDIPSIQVLTLIYKALEERKECEKIYKAALKKFPTSGVLYNEYGEMLWTKKDYSEAVKLWEKGIETDPNHSGNYYNAAKYYYLSADKVWGLIYGEIFVNQESYSARTVEIKTLMLDGYKKLFTGNDIYSNQDMKNEFVKAFLETMNKHAGIVASGITPENITALRTRFILDWYANNAAKFPCRLFEHQNQLLKLGFFSAYNQWIFGAAANLNAYQQWTNNNSEENKEFLRLQQNRVYKTPAGQYYQTIAK